MKRKFIIFNQSDYRCGAGVRDGYYSICLEDLENMENVYVNNAPFEHFPRFLHLQLIDRALHRLRMPFFYKLFYPIVLRKSKIGNNPCFVFIRYTEVGYVKWLRSKYPKAVFIKFVRDLIHTQQSVYDSFKKANVFDYWITFDEQESKRYGMFFYPEIESKIDLPSCNIQYDVFFAGRAKNRLPILIEVYDYLSKAGLNCYFYITGHKENEIVKRPGIVYSNKLMTYREMLIKNLQSRCILEINQIGAVGLTSRFLEAVMYNRLLLTNNHDVTLSPLYDPKYIQVFNRIEEVDTSFIKDIVQIDYHYDNEFSPVGLLDYIESILQKEERF